MYRRRRRHEGINIFQKHLSVYYIRIIYNEYGDIKMYYRDKDCYRQTFHHSYRTPPYNPTTTRWPDRVLQKINCHQAWTVRFSCYTYQSVPYMRHGGAHSVTWVVGWCSEDSIIYFSTDISCCVKTVRSSREKNAPECKS